MLVANRLFNQYFNYFLQTLTGRREKIAGTPFCALTPVGSQLDSCLILPLRRSSLSGILMPEKMRDTLSQLQMCANLYLFLFPKQSTSIQNQPPILFVIENKFTTNGGILNYPSIFMKDTKVLCAPSFSNFKIKLSHRWQIRGNANFLKNC